jgi:hypothetical protein
MNIFTLFINDVKHKQYKTMDDALKYCEEIIKNSSSKKLKIILEEFCEFGYSDSCCKIYELYEYSDNKVKKLIKY